MIRLASVLLIAIAGCSGPARGPGSNGGGAVLTHGPMAFDAGASSVTIWARADRDATVVVSVARDGASPVTTTARALASDDYTVAVRIAKLEPGTSYSVAVAIEGQDTAPARGSFRTASAVASGEAVSFVWTGDLSGQNVCRDAERGFPITQHIAAAAPHFFVALGDMIYADQTCEAKGRYGNAQVAGSYPVATTLESFWQHWRYNRADPELRAFSASTTTYALWDDHEVVDDFGPTSHPPLVPLGLEAFLDYNPIAEAGAPLYRSVRWGKHVELLILDNRSHRSPNTALDNGEEPKTMLGKTQLAWLLERLQSSDATWKIVASSVPISIPTGADPPQVARDGWADFGSGQGFERELRGIVSAAAAAGANMVWITTDVHFSSVFRYQPRPDYTFHELVVGPMNAGLFPKDEVDDSLAPERLFFHGPGDPDALTYEQALGFMTFGRARVSGEGKLSLEIVNAVGKRVFELSLNPRPAPAATGE